MIKFKLISIFIFIFAYSYSQDSKKLTIGIYYQPGISNRYNTKELEGLTYKARLGYATGLDIDYRLCNKFWLNSGLGVTYRSFKYFIEGGEVSPNSAGITYLPSWEEKLSSYSVTIPLRLIFMTKYSQHSTMGFNCGVGYNLKFKTSEKINNVNQNRIYALFGLDFQYYLNELLSVYIQPNLDIETINIDDSWENNMLWRNYDFGFKVGVKYRL